MTPEKKVEGLLDRFQITYRRPGEGPNVNIGWLGLDCPRCGDTSKHLGVNVASLHCYCWRCQNNMHLHTLLMEEFNVPWGEIKLYGSGQAIESPSLSSNTGLEDHVSSILADDSKPTYTARNPEPRPDGMYALTATTTFPAMDNFLKSREYTIEDAESHGCFVGHTGVMANRLVFPIVDPETNEPVAWVGRGIAPAIKPKYKAKGPVNDYLYGFETITPGQPLIVVEGIFDQWRMGPNSVACFGKALTKSQQRLVRKLRPNPLYLVWDADAFWEAVEIRDVLTEYGYEVVHVELPEGEDPDTLGQDKVLTLIDEKDTDQKWNPSL